MVQPYLPKQYGYSVRNENNTFHPPFSRTSSFYYSNIFKNRLTHFYRTWDAKAFYYFGIRKFNIIHCQLRNEASNLKAHLFNDFLSDNTDFPNCGCPLEDNNHFLFICPKYNNIRLVLLDSRQTHTCIYILTPKNNNVNINIDLLLHGNRSFSYDINKEIFQTVHKYKSGTHRFI